MMLLSFVPFDITTICYLILIRKGWGDIVLCKFCCLQILRHIYILLERDQDRVASDKLFILIEYNIYNFPNRYKNFLVRDNT